MYGILKPRQMPVLWEDPSTPGGLRALTIGFLKQARQAALGRFDGHRILSSGCHTVQRSIEARAGTRCTGTIVAHVSGRLFDTWAAASPGTPAQRKAHVQEQLQLVLQDLCDHDVHGYLALTDAQCDMYDLDLVQLVTESLDRTTFAALDRPCKVYWEGTLVKSLQPPSLVLVVSIGAEPTARP